MSRELTIWLLIFAVGAITYAARLSFIAVFARRDMPALLAEALKHVPVAMVTAIVVPAVVFMPAGALRLDLGNPKLIAALVAAAVAWWSKSAVATIVVGMAALCMLRYFAG
ncbi:MAG: branched-chain amino acid ABC transporter permease [Proteobacteria bacterium]|nr:MAG: branched-chain amino acid ABC transporter permease [Pseudomonadota bacterium]